MKLITAAIKFDLDPLYDAYSGDYLYKGQFSTYESSQLDGSFIRRRTVSMHPELQLPPRRAVTLYGETWVLSDPIFDGWKGKPVRQTMSARKCHALYKVVTPENLFEELKPLEMREAYAFSRLTKGTADAATSNLEPYYEFSFSLTEDSVTGLFIRDGKKVWYVRMSADVSEGFLVAEADLLVDGTEQENGFFKAELDGYNDPVTLDQVTGNLVDVLLVDRYNFFTKLDQAQPNNYHGDKTLVLAEELEGTQVRIGADTWTVQASQPLKGGFAYHVRKM